MSNSTNISSGNLFPVNYKVEITAGFSTFLTLSYVFLLNPILLSKAGIDISAAFFATIVSAATATLIMGFWAKLPFAVAPAPSITTFFVSYVCLKMGLTWEAALAAVILSGLLSILMTALSFRGKLIDSISKPLSIGVLFAIGGFLVANGLVQAKLISYSSGGLDFAKINIKILGSGNAIVLYVGLIVTWLFRFRLKWFNFSGAPILGILAATIVAASFGIKATTKAQMSYDMFSSFWHFDLSALLDSRFLIAILIFFIIDFFGGVGKYIGLFAAMGSRSKEIKEKGMKKALYVDGIGNIIGGIFGASSLAVFVSSAVGIQAGGRTGVTAITSAILMLLSLFVIPLVGAIPVEATSGVLIYVGLLLIPYKEIQIKNGFLNSYDLFVSIAAAGVSLFTYGIDKAILLVFLVYTIQRVIKGATKADIMLIITTFLLLIAIIAQALL